jgi:surfactin family lipopeptide synthetase A/fengycin family lipopeptide synthetase B
MQRSFRKLIERHDVLRTVFVYTEVEQPLQLVLSQREPQIDYKDLTAYSKVELARFIEAHKIRDREHKFNLEAGPLIRMIFFKTDECTHQVIWGFHHIIIDGWCMGILAQDLFHIYKSLVDDAPIELPPPYPYNDYIQWLSEQDQEKALQYWSEYLKDYELQAAVPSPQGGVKQEGFDHRKYSFKWDSDTTRRLQRLAVNNQVTLSTLFHTIWGILLQQYNHNEDVVFGSVVSGRPPELSGVENMVGLFINTVPLRVKSDASTSFQRLLGIVHDSMLEANRHHYVSLADIQSKTVLKNHLINHIVVFENYPLDTTLGADGDNHLAITESEMLEHTNYDLDITVFPEDELEVLFTYNGFVYDEAFLQNLEGHLRKIANNVLENEQILIRDIEVITENEKKEIIGGFNCTDRDYRIDMPAHRLFEEQVRCYPDRTAIIYKEERITYDQLNRNANRLARLFMQRGLGQGDFAAVMLERSPLMVESILAIWKLGAAYIPVDVLYPEDRKMGILADSNANIIVTLSEFTEHGLHAHYPDRLVELDRVAYPTDEESERDLDLQAASTDLAYVLFTSGSTGKPKGVMIEHLGMLNHIYAEVDDLGLSDNLVFAQTANHCFDISVWQFFGALVIGGTTAIYPDEVILAPDRFLNQIISDRVTLLEVVPSYLAVLLDLVKAQSIRFEDLEHLMITGEAATPAIVARWFELCPGIKMVNAYGPAEASDDICQYVMDQVPENRGSIPIGKPLPNIRIYIVNDQMHLCPVGIIGEICVAGIAVGRGYLNDPRRTEPSFIEDLFALQPGARLYKTGDLGRWLPDGNIEFAGRKDYQVKIRGFRIELGEIEHRLTEHRQVREAAVLVKGAGEAEKYLYAYYTAEIDLTASELKAYLNACLPEYMVPSVFVQLAEMPHNANGKIDRNALPEPSPKRADRTFVTARNEVEKTLVSIWEEVLGVSMVSMEDNFFELGGHSLKATVIVSRVHGELGADAKVKDVFQFPTVELLARRIQELSGQPCITVSISPAPVMDYYPVSPAQKRMYVLQSLEDSGSTTYNMPFAYRIQGPLDISRFQRTVNRFIQRHEGFRTSFHLVDGELVQMIHSEAECKLETVEMIGAAKEEIDRRILLFVQPFNLGEAPLMRVQLLLTGREESVLLIDMHHIVSDGLSGPIMLRELERLYMGDELPPLEIQYKDYSVWLNERQAGEEMKAHEEYWKTQFSGELSVLNMPLDYSRPALQSFNGQTLQFVLQPGLSRAVRELAQDTGTTLYALLLAAYQVLLSKYTGQEDIVVGSPVSGRNHQDVQDMLGMFINTVALRNFPLRHKTFRQFVQEVKESTLSAIDHQDLPFERLVELLDVERDTSRNPLFDTMFNLTDREEQEIHIGELLLTPYELKHDISKFDLMLDAYMDNVEISFDLQYNTDLFSVDTANRIGRHYTTLLHNITANPDIPLAGIHMLLADEREEILGLSRGKAVEYDFSLTVPRRFEQFALEHPDLPAVKFAGNALTYNELNSRANQFAHYLQRRLGELGADAIAAVMLERSPDFIQSVLGIWKAGGAYVPIDMEYGVQRKADILADSRARVLITRSAYIQDGLDELYDGVILCLDQVLEEISGEGTDNIGIAITANNLAYILFTSGSTGKPKGVMIEHQGMLNHILAEADELGLDQRLVFAQNANICFDISVWQCFGALALGGTTAIYPQELVLEVERFIEAVIEDQVTLLEVVPSYLVVMLDVLEQTRAKLHSLRYLMITGETIKADLAERWLNLYPEIGIVNAYGPAEAGDDVSQCVISEILPEGMASVPIGKPLANLNLYVVDEQMNLCPAGVYGEICVSGIGVGRGYIYDSERTARSFMRDPFVSDTENPPRLYKTGDLGRWLPDGNLEFLGRKDFQVKIRGFRIELEEIEVRILQSPHIKQTIVLAREDETGNKYLCAYLVFDGSKTGQEEACVLELKNELEKALPGYMIPSYFVTLEQLPLLISGKIDRAALPAPDRSTTLARDYTAPRNEIEQIMASVWEEVLGISQVGIDHNFFDLGGDSIRAIQISSKLSSQGYTLKMKDLFQNPVIRKLSKYIQLDHHEIDQGPVEGFVELTPIQKWFFDCGFSPANHWNQAVVLYKQDGFEEELLSKAFTELICHHDALRMVYRQNAGEWTQYNEGLSGQAERSWFDLIVTAVPDGDEGKMEMSRRIDELHGSINLERGPLVKIGLFKTDNGDHLAIVVHHLVIDGISWRILFEDLTVAYQQAAKGEPIILPAKTDSFRTWAERLKDHAESKSMQAELSYWKQIESTPTKALPKSSHRTGPAKVMDNMTYSFQLPKLATEQLLGKVHKAYNTEINDILLTALGRAVWQWTGEQDHVLICLEGHGREEILKNINISRTVGWFTSTYPVVLNVPSSADVSYQIKSIKENLRRIPNKGIGYGLLRYLASHHQLGETRFHLEPEIKFNYLGQFDNDVNTGVFQGSNVPYGQTVSPEAEREIALNITGLVENGQLEMTIEYNLAEFSEADISRFGRYFKMQLTEIIKHCMERDTQELTPSDVGGDDLSIEELEAIVNFYNQ